MYKYKTKISALFLIIVFLLPLPLHSEVAGKTDEDMHKQLRGLVKNGGYAITRNKKIILSININRKFIPASISKFITVLAAIDKLGYRPSKVARALVTSRTDTIGLLIGDIANPYFSEVARGVLDTAKEPEYDVFLCNTAGAPLTEKRALYSLIDHNIDGAIIYPTWKNKDWLPKFAQANCPLVLVNSRVEPEAGISLVQTKIQKGANLAVKYLIEKGHLEIGMIAGEVSPIERGACVQF